jgi:hypothetical protein
MSSDLEFSAKNFFNDLIFHPEHGKTKKDQNKALKYTIILGICTLGIAHMVVGVYKLGCYAKDIWDQYQVSQKKGETLNSADTKAKDLAKTYEITTNASTNASEAVPQSTTNPKEPKSTTGTNDIPSLRADKKTDIPLLSATTGTKGVPSVSSPAHTQPVTVTPTRIPTKNPFYKEYVPRNEPKKAVRGTNLYEGFDTESYLNLCRSEWEANQNCPDRLINLFEKMIMETRLRGWDLAEFTQKAIEQDHHMIFLKKILSSIKPCKSIGE